MKLTLAIMLSLVAVAACTELEEESDLDELEQDVSWGYPQMRFVWTNRCMDLGVYPAVVQKPCNGGATQGWAPLVVNSADITTVSLQNESTGRCLDRPWGWTAIHTQLQEFNCHYQAAQLWKIRKPSNTRWQFEAVTGWDANGRGIGSGMCIDVPNSTTAEVQLQLFPCKAASDPGLGNQVVYAPW